MEPLTFVLGLGLVCAAGGVAAQSFRARNDAELTRENQILNETLDAITADAIDQYAIDDAPFVRAVIGRIAVMKEALR